MTPLLPSNTYPRDILDHKMVWVDLTNIAPKRATFARTNIVNNSLLLFSMKFTKMHGYRCTSYYVSIYSYTVHKNASLMKLRGKYVAR